MLPCHVVPMRYRVRVVRGVVRRAVRQTQSTTSLSSTAFVVTRLVAVLGLDLRLRLDEGVVADSNLFVAQTGLWPVNHSSVMPLACMIVLASVAIFDVHAGPLSLASSHCYPFVSSFW